MNCEVRARALRILASSGMSDEDLLAISSVLGRHHEPNKVGRKTDSEEDVIKKVYKVISNSRSQGASRREIQRKIKCLRAGSLAPILAKMIEDGQIENDKMGKKRIYKLLPHHLVINEIAISHPHLLDMKEDEKNEFEDVYNAHLENVTNNYY